jgi:hypothetical protein
MWTAFSGTARTLSVQPGRYDVYWVQRADLNPLPIASGVEVGPTGASVSVVTGVRLAVADWARIDGTAQWAATAAGQQGAIVNDTTANAMLLPPGDYDVYWKAGDNVGFGWMATVNVPPPSGSLGVEVEVTPEGLRVVNAAPGGAADRAGVRTGDVISAVDGRTLTGLQLAAAVAILRGPPNTTSALTVLRATGATAIPVTRSGQPPIATVTANSGIRLKLAPGQALNIGQTGWWGAVLAGADINTAPPVNRSRDAGVQLPLPPATYDLYWRPDEGTPPAVLARGVVVRSGQVSEATAAP